MRPDRNKLDLGTLLSLAQQYSPEHQAQSDLDRARLAEVLASSQYAQQMGYPSMAAMKYSQEDADRNQRNEVNDLAKQQSMQNSKAQLLEHQMNAATSARRPDLLPYLFQQAYPDMPQAAPPPPPKEKKGWFNWFS